MENDNLEEMIYAVYKLLAAPMKAEEIQKAFPETEKKVIKQALNSLITQGLIMKNKKNRYAQSTHYGYVSGIFNATASAEFGFVCTEEEDKEEYKKPDIYIPASSASEAFHGDRVLVRLSGKMRKGHREGEVVKVLSRSEKELNGKVEQRGRKYFLIPKDKKYPEIELETEGGAADNEFVSVLVTGYGPLRGRVTARFGQNGTIEASIASVLRSNSVEDEFPEEVITQANEIPQEVTDIRGRLDLRDKLIFTIDGDDAKDFDDAVSIETLENGNFLLGVHIADVSNYVTPGSPLDGEAFKRGTSVYFPGHVVPMLPFELSNGICSLNPDADRLAFSVLMELDKDGRRHRSEFKKSVIRSKARMTYKKVNKILGGDKELRDEYAFLVETIGKMDSLANTLAKRRAERGALELDIPETQITVDENNEPLEINSIERGDSERLIEEFMLQANEAVAEYMCRRGAPTVYRVHESPDPDKLRTFAQFARPFGYRIDPGRADDTFQLQAVLRGSKGDPKQRILPMLLLRSLARAKYSETCIGHYGLKAKFYLHFTSPIRRYPDLVAHRMLEKAINGDGFKEADNETCAEAAGQSTVRESAADNCEREIDKLFIAKYMKRFIGEEFDAEIANIQSFGIFVALENGCEGLVRIELLEGDFFEYDEQHMLLQGRHTGKRFSIGMPLRVRLIASSEVTGQIDFAPAENELCRLPSGEFVPALKVIKERKPSERKHHEKRSRDTHYRRGHKRRKRR